MRNFIIFIFSCFLATPASAEAFVLDTAEARDDYYFIQLNHGLGEGEQFSSLFEKEINKENIIKVRLLGEFSDEVNDELISYYKREMPNELDAAFSSSGNHDNPALKPLIKSFPSALKTTSLFQSIDTAFNSENYSNTNIEFEKFSLIPSNEKKIWVADIWLTFERKNNF